MSEIEQKAREIAEQFASKGDCAWTVRQEAIRLITEALRATTAEAATKLRMIVSHATGGSLHEIDGLSVNDICVAISANRGLIYEQGKSAAIAAMSSCRTGGVDAEPVGEPKTVSITAHAHADGSPYLRLGVEPKGEQHRAYRMTLSGAEILAAEIAGILEPATLLREPEREEGGWRDMASAPKDGTLILSYGPGWPHWEIVRWAHRHERSPGPEWCRNGYTAAYVCDTPKMPPTRWMPLPSPPRTEEGGR